MQNLKRCLKVVGSIVTPIIVLWLLWGCAPVPQEHVIAPIQINSDQPMHINVFQLRLTQFDDGVWQRSCSDERGRYITVSTNAQTCSRVHYVGKDSGENLDIYSDGTATVVFAAVPALLDRYDAPSINIYDVIVTEGVKVQGCTQDMENIFYVLSTVDELSCVRGDDYIVRDNSGRRFAYSNDHTVGIISRAVKVSALPELEPKIAEDVNLYILFDHWGESYTVYSVYEIDSLADQYIPIGIRPDGTLLVSDGTTVLNGDVIEVR